MELALNKIVKNLTKRQTREIAAIAAKKDANIDLSEMPEVVDWTGAEMGQVLSPAKKSPSPCVWMKM